MLFTKRRALSQTLWTPPTGLGWSGLVARVFPNLTRRAPVGGVLEHLGTLPLTPHSSLVLVRLRRQTLLIGATAQSLSILAKEDDVPADGAVVPTAAEMGQ